MNQTDLTLAGGELDSQLALSQQDNLENDKIQSLQEAHQEKLDRLSPNVVKADDSFTPDMLLSMNDADSLVTQNAKQYGLAHTENPTKDAYGNTRSATSPSDYGYDAVETQHFYPGAPRPIDDARNNPNKSANQFAEVARLVGKNPNDVTNQDFLDVSSMQTIQKLADLARKPGEARWEAPLIKNVTPVNLTGHYKDEYGNKQYTPLDVPITSKYVGEGTYRPLYSFGNQAGYNVTATSELDPRLNASIQVTAPQKLDTHGLQKALLTRESSGNYKAVNDGGYVGGYQFGAAVLSDLGMVKKGTINKDLTNPNVWTGRGGIKSLDEFLNNSKVQDKLMTIRLNSLAKQLKGGSTNAQDLAGKIAAAHLLGVKGSKDLSHTDGNGTKGQEYYNIGFNSAGGTAATNDEMTLAYLDKIGAEVDNAPDYSLTGLTWNALKSGASGVLSFATNTIDTAADIEATAGQKIYEFATGKKLAPEGKKLDWTGYHVDKDGQLRHYWGWEKPAKGKGTDTETKMHDLLGVNSTAASIETKGFQDDMERITQDPNTSNVAKIGDIAMSMWQHKAALPQVVADSAVYMTILTNPAGFAAMTANGANDILDQRRAQTHKPATAQDVMISVVASAAEQGSEFLGDKMAFGVGKGLGNVNAKIIKYAFKIAPKGMSARVGAGLVKAIVSKVGAATLAGTVEEMPTEALQAAIAIVAKNVGIEGYTMKDVYGLLDPKSMEIVRRAGWSGLQGGFGQSAAGGVYNTVMSEGSSKLDKLTKSKATGSPKLDAVLDHKKNNWGQTASVLHTAVANGTLDEATANKAQTKVDEALASLTPMIDGTASKEVADYRATLPDGNKQAHADVIEKHRNDINEHIQEVLKSKTLLDSYRAGTLEQGKTKQSDTNEDGKVNATGILHSNKVIDNSKVAELLASLTSKDGKDKTEDEQALIKQLEIQKRMAKLNTGSEAVMQEKLHGSSRRLGLYDYIEIFEKTKKDSPVYKAAAVAFTSFFQTQNDKLELYKTAKDSVYGMMLKDGQLTPEGVDQMKTATPLLTNGTNYAVDSGIAKDDKSANITAPIRIATEPAPGTKVPAGTFEYNKKWYSIGAIGGQIAKMQGEQELFANEVGPYITNGHQSSTEKTAEPTTETKSKPISEMSLADIQNRLKAIMTAASTTNDEGAKSKLRSEWQALKDRAKALKEKDSIKSKKPEQVVPKDSKNTENKQKTTNSAFKTIDERIAKVEELVSKESRTGWEKWLNAEINTLRTLKSKLLRRDTEINQNRKVKLKEQISRLQERLDKQEIRRDKYKAKKDIPLKGAAKNVSEAANSASSMDSEDQKAKNVKQATQPEMDSYAKTLSDADIAEMERLHKIEQDGIAKETEAVKEEQTIPKTTADVKPNAVVEESKDKNKAQQKTKKPTKIEDLGPEPTVEDINDALTKSLPQDSDIEYISELDNSIDYKAKELSPEDQAKVEELNKKLEDIEANIADGIDMVNLLTSKKKVVADKLKWFGKQLHRNNKQLTKYKEEGNTPQIRAKSRKSVEALAKLIKVGNVLLKFIAKFKEVIAVNTVKFIHLKVKTKIAKDSIAKLKEEKKATQHELEKYTNPNIMKTENKSEDFNYEGVEGMTKELNDIINDKEIAKDVRELAEAILNKDTENEAYKGCK